MLVAVTGPIAAGATTLAKGLAEQMKWRTVFEEDVERNNPFFAKYHAEPMRFAFENQIGFMTQSAELHERLRATPQEVMLVQDYTPFEHTEVYAEVQASRGILSADAVGLLRRAAKQYGKLYVVPDVLVYRRVAESALAERVRQRGRPSEQVLDDAYLRAIHDRFDEWIGVWTRSPVVRVESNVDVVGSVEAIGLIGAQVLSALKGRQVGNS